ncbi:MAG: glycosyltransferase family 39 protein [Bacteroidales bacterium]|nr:glycosyltransferase family 39 protein [Bacteroidales bacterium]
MNRLVYISLWVFIAALIVCLILPGLFMDGMFADGTQYACVSKNLSNGLGSFWFPFISDSWNKQGTTFFLEQPPLLYGLQAPFFKILGDSMYTERIYIFLTLIVNTLIIILIWRYVAPEKHKKHAWLALLYWISIPLTSWTFMHNMQENTMMIFTSLAIYFGLRSVMGQSLNLLNGFIAGIFIFLATLTKGMPGLFPVVVAGIAMITIRQVTLKRALILSCIYVFTPLTIYIILMTFNDTAYESIMFYLRSRLLVRVTSKPVVDSHFYMLGRLTMELLPGLFLAALLITWDNIKSSRFNMPNKLRSVAALFILLGLAGSLPLMLTLVQRGFYMNTSFPMFAIGLAALTLPSSLHIFSTIKEKAGRYMLVASVFLLIAGLTLTIVLSGKPKQNKDSLSDVYTFQKYINPFTTVGCDRNAFDDWHFHFYLIRYNDVYLKYSKKTMPEFFITSKDELPYSDDLYHKIDIQTQKYNLYKFGTGQ